jgi:sulfhydrogenase subunit beta (sulfur reductase)
MSAPSKHIVHAVIDRKHLQQLLDALNNRGYQVIGPTVREQTVVYDTLTTIDDLPIGYRDEQSGGQYRLVPRNDQTLFGYVVGPHAWKKFLFPPAVRLWEANRSNGTGFTITQEPPEVPRMALFGARSCELHAISIQDRVFMDGPYADPIYTARRANLFIVAVNCVEPGGTCFCASMGTGPKAESGFDLALTEVLDGSRHEFVVAIGSEAGAAVLDDVQHRAATDADLKLVEKLMTKSAKSMGRTLETKGIKELLNANAEHPQWEDVASRCMTCGNCTMVCPTCFCTTVEDVTDLSGDHAERWRRWDSCFTMDFSYIYGGSVRVSGKSRYRQWLTHKLAAWIDQFGTSGCVGCGRCITWCPVGIDITSEVAAIRKTSAASTVKRRR